MAEKGRIAGKVALVTGAASGIGLATAELFTCEGATVILSDIDDMPGQAAAARIGGCYLHQDVASEEEWIGVLKTIRDRHARLDILVNNAGMAIGGDITGLSLVDWRRQQAINVEGVFLGIKHALPLMRENGGGAIVNVASTVALTGSGNLVSYAATKGAVRSLTRSVALQCAARKDGVRVNAVYPGIIDTPIYGQFEGTPKTNADGSRPLARDPEALSARFVPVGVPGTPQDIAAGILYLASDDARYVTGTELVIDGGLAG
jgi:NAD(P)-dependent dehydrogenase (short-subunit alcohol dehydrogenase family)